MLRTTFIIFFSLVFSIQSSEFHEELQWIIESEVKEEGLESTTYADVKVKGKVILLAYWPPVCKTQEGITYQSRLQTLSKTFSKTDHFVLIGVYDNFLPNEKQREKSSFPLIQGITHDDDNDHMPNRIKHRLYKVLIDHKGRLIKSGNITSKDIKDAISDVEGISPMWSGVDVLHNKKIAKKLQIGTPIRSLLNSLESLSKNDDDAGKEAKLILSSVKEWGENEFAEIEKLKSTAPTEALIRMEILLKTFYGLPLVTNLPNEIRTMKGDRYLLSLLKLRSEVDRLKSNTKVSSTAQNYLKNKLEDYLKNPVSEALKSEAQSLLNEVASLKGE